MRTDVGYRGQSSTLPPRLVLGDSVPSVSILNEHLAGSVLFPGSVPHRDPVWAAGGDCALGNMVWPCVSHPPLSSPPDGGLYHGYRPVTLG